MLRRSSLPHALRVAARAALLVPVAVLMPLTLTLPSYAGPAVVHTGAALARPVDTTQPLVLRMQSITPDYVPDSGPIVVQGTITNASDERWTDINVHGFIGTTPLTTSTALADATETPVDADVGARITEPGTFDSIGAMAPGESTTFEVRLPRSTLGVTAPGVYWFGVHALGTNAEGRSLSAVGRDRTFLTFVPRSLQTTGSIEDVALVAPVRSGVTRGSDGTIQDTSGWRKSLNRGRLHQAVALGRAAQSHPLTWLLDPAVIDAVRQLAGGNQPRTLSAPGSHRGGPSQTPSPSASASTSDTAEASAGTATSPSTVRAARRWLERYRSVLTTGTSQVLGLPYGDLAVHSALAFDEPLLDEAVRRTGHLLRPWRVPVTPSVSPPGGSLAADDLARLRRSTEVLLDDTGFDGAAPAAAQIDGHSVVFAASAASDGGPGPVDPTSNLALRQRILAEAAVRYLDQQQALIVRIPEGLRRPRPAFFTGLDVPWVRLTTVSDATAGVAAQEDPASLREPDPDEPQLGPRVYDAATRALDHGQMLQSVLADNQTLRRTIFTEVSGNASYSAAGDRFGALARMETTSDWVTDNLQGIDLAAPASVTLASTSGRFAAVVSNALDVPVTVKVRALSDAALHVTGGGTFQLAPHGQTNVLLKAATDVPGVHTVTLQLTNQAGEPLGTAGSFDSFPMRAVQVSRLIWVIIGAGVALLFAAIVVRLTRRFLRRGQA